MPRPASARRRGSGSRSSRRRARPAGSAAAWRRGSARSLREIIDWSALRRAIGGVKLTEPAVAMRAARQAVKVEKAQDLMRLAGDVGRVQSKAGTRAALDGLKLAEGPRDMSRIARLAATKGGKTRAILKVAGRSAIMLTMGTFNLAMWMFWALLTLLGFVSLAQAHDRAHHRALLRTPQVAPRARARTMRARAARRSRRAWRRPRLRRSKSRRSSSPRRRRSRRGSSRTIAAGRRRGRVLRHRNGAGTGPRDMVRPRRAR